MSVNEAVYVFGRTAHQMRSHSFASIFLPSRSVGSAYYDYDLSRFVDLDAGDVHTSRSDCLDCSGHVLLPECGGRARHP